MRSSPSPLLLLALAGTALLAPSPLEAQGFDTAPFILVLPAGPRAQALGGAGVALTDPEAVFYNPAQILGARGIDLSVGFYRGVGNLAALSTAMPIFGGAVGIGAQRLEFYVPTATTPRPRGGEAGLTRRSDVLATSALAALGYARSYRGFRVGVGAKYVEQRMPEERSSVIVGDVGVARSFGQGIWVGLAAQNLGPDFELGDEQFDLPRRYTLGAAFQNYQVSTWFDLGMSVAIPVYEDGSVLAGGGVELSYVPIEGFVITGRFGGRAVRHRAEFPLTSGLAVGFDNLVLEYAFQSFDYPGYAHRVGLKLLP